VDFYGKLGNNGKFSQLQFYGGHKPGSTPNMNEKSLTLFKQQKLQQV
jgi:hypothetical protein